jgi:hypothetical protein
VWRPKTVLGIADWLCGTSTVKLLDSFPACYETRRFITVFTRALHLYLQGIRPRPRLMMFRNRFIFYGEGLLAPRPTPKLEDHTLSSVCGCLFNIFAANLHSWRTCLYPRTEDAPCCGDGSHLTCNQACYRSYLILYALHVRHCYYEYRWRLL